MIRFILLVASVFAKIGLFTLGGGLAIIALVEQETLSRGWLSHSEFLDILAIAQVTPGPMGVNAATFTGWRTAINVSGSVGWAFTASLVATISVVLASVIGVIFLGNWFERNREKTIVKTIFSILRPVVAGVIFAVGVNMVLAVFGAEGIDGAKCIYFLKNLKFEPIGLIACAGTFILTVTRRFSPLWGLRIGAILVLIFI